MSMDLLDRLITDIFSVTENVMNSDEIDLKVWQPFQQKTNAEATHGSLGAKPHETHSTRGLCRRVCIGLCAEWVDGMEWDGMGLDWMGMKLNDFTNTKLLVRMCKLLFRPTIPTTCSLRPIRETSQPSLNSIDTAAGYIFLLMPSSSSRASCRIRQTVWLYAHNSFPWAITIAQVSFRRAQLHGKVMRFSHVPMLVVNVL
jgi:hypothetical protein